MEFLTQDLDDDRQPAVARLVDDVSSHETTLTQAKFDSYDVVITRFGTDSKPKQYRLNWVELLALGKAAEAYQQAIADHAAAKEARRDAIVSAGQTLARSVQFDLDTLNVRAKHDGDGWKIIIPAIRFENYCEPEELKDMVQAALDCIKSEVKWAEEHEYTSPEWLKIIASYRRVFPLEPQEITEARNLLTEAGLTDWQLIHCHPEPTADCWSFVTHASNPESTKGQDSFTLIDKPAKDMLKLIDQYVTMTKQGIWTADFQPLTIIDERTEQGEPEEIQEARRWLNGSAHPEGWEICPSYPGTNIDSWSFDNGQDGVKHHTMYNQPATRILSFIQGYLGEERDQTQITTR